MTTLNAPGREPVTYHTVRTVGQEIARYHLIAPDYPGFGHSSWPAPGSFAYTFDHPAQVMQAFADELTLLWDARRANPPGWWMTGGDQPNLMMFSPMEPLEENRPAAMLPKLNMTIIYECVDTGKHAKHFSERLAAEMAAGRALKLNLWNFRVLGIPDIRNAAASAAASADAVIFSMSGRTPLPAPVERWIEMWLWLIDRGKPAVVALSAANQVESARIQAGLRHAALAKGLPFFPQMGSSLTDAKRHPEFAAMERWETADNPPRVETDRPNDLHG